MSGIRKVISPSLDSLLDNVAVFVLLICSILINGLASVAVNVFISDVSGELKAFELLTTTLAVAETAAFAETDRTFVVSPEIVNVMMEYLLLYQLL